MTKLLLLALLVGQAPAARIYVLEPAKSTVRFHVVHPLHKVDGRAPVVEAKAVLGADGELRAMARAQVAALETGDGNRDANLRAVMDADRYPFVVLKGTTRLVAPAALPADVPLKLAGEVEVHGVRRPVEIPLVARFDADGAARVQGTFDVSLEAHGVERPSLLFKKVEDRCRIDVDLSLRSEPR